MPVTVKITGDKKTSRKLKRLGPISARSATSARKKSVRSGRTRMIRDIGSVLKLPAKRIRRTVLSSANALFVRDGDQERPPTLAAFGGRFLRVGNRSRGYRVTTWRGLGPQIYRQGFFVPGTNIPFERTGPGRDSPIVPIRGPRIGEPFSQNADVVIDFMRFRIRSEWQRAVRGALLRP